MGELVFLVSGLFWWEIFLAGDVMIPFDVGGGG